MEKICYKRYDYIDAIRDSIEGMGKFGGNKMPTERGLKGNFRFIDVLGFIPKIKKVIFNDPATIVYWNDGTKTVVKANNGDEFDAEKGLAMAVVKKTIGLKEFYKVCERDKDGNEAWPCKWEEK